MSASGSISDAIAAATATEQAATNRTASANGPTVATNTAAQHAAPKEAVTISDAALQMAQSTAVLVRSQIADGESVEMIAQELDTTPQAVRSYLEVTAAAD
jgi:hypothetical protein